MVSKRLVPMIVVIAVGVLLFSCTLNKVDSNRLSDLNKSASEAYSSHEYAKSMTDYIVITDEFPKEKDGYIGVVKILVDKNIFDKAETVIAGANKNIGDASTAELYTILGDRYYAVGDYDNAYRVFKLAKGLDESNQGIMIRNLRSSLKLGKLQEAKSYVGISSDNENYLESLILNSFMQLDDLEKAKSLISKVGEQDLLENSTTKNNKVFGDKTVEEIYLSYKNSLDLASKNTGNTTFISTIIAREYIYADYSNIAVYLLEPKKDSFTNYYDGYYFLALAYYEAGEFQKTVDIGLVSESAGFDMYEMQLLIARSYWRLNDLPNCSKYYEKSIQFVPDVEKVGYMYEYFEALMDFKQYSKATIQLNNIEARANTAKLQAAYLELYFAIPDFTKVPTHLESLATFASTDNSYQRILLENKVMYYIEMKDAVLTKDYLDVLGSLNATDANYNLLLGRYYILISDKASAKKSFEKAAEYDLQGTVSASAEKYIASL
jgi:hypothetical protein